MGKAELMSHGRPLMPGDVSFLNCAFVLGSGMSEEGQGPRGGNFFEFEGIKASKDRERKSRH